MIFQTFFLLYFLVEILRQTEVTLQYSGPGVCPGPNSPVLWNKVTIGQV